MHIVVDRLYQARAHVSRRAHRVLHTRAIIQRQDAALPDPTLDGHQHAPAARCSSDRPCVQTPISYPPLPPRYTPLDNQAIKHKLISDFFLLEKRYNPPASTAGATTLAVSFGAAYSVWVEHCAKQNGRYPYPFLNVMSADERMAMYIGSTVLALLAFWGLNALHK